MKLLYLLHFYQPDFQFFHTLEHVYKSSYKEIFRIVKNSPNGKIVVNITGSTLKLFERWGVGELSKDLQELYNLNKIEFTATAFTHALLNYTSPTQTIRQITRDITTLREMIDPSIQPQFLYPPEMFVSPKVVEAAKACGLKGVFISTNSLPKPHKFKSAFSYSNVTLLRRNTNISRWCENHGIFSRSQLDKVIKEHNFDINRPMVITHDAEIIGHHFKDKIKLFEELMNDPQIEWYHTHDFIDINEVQAINTLHEASWEKMPVRGKEIDPHWRNDKNLVHKAMWELTDTVVETIESLQNSPQYAKLQDQLDYIQYSCQYWWASSYPFWSAEIVVNTMWRWFKLNAEVYQVMKKQKDIRADIFLRKTQQLIFKILNKLATYEAKSWHTKNIAYYDKYLLPMKKKGVI
ncbi:MAG: hypothetical protein KatS3mg087_0318 [Patescibacteria group bacterium]|nr:MAG: hypothetical protein KatS3mg087_0318 [Patescibacteria group bacterium]